MKPVADAVNVSGLVSARDKDPYVLLELGHEKAQLTIAQARKIALDLLHAASRYEADAMIFRFFEHHDLPAQAAGQLMREFRDFRLKLDDDPVESLISDPINPEETFKNSRKA